MQEAGHRDHQEEQPGHQEVKTGVEGRAGNRAVLEVALPTVTLRPPCRPPVVLLGVLVKEAQAEGLDRRPGEVGVVAGVLPHALDHHDVSLLPELGQFRRVHGRGGGRCGLLGGALCDLVGRLVGLRIVGVGRGFQ